MPSAFHGAALSAVYRMVPKPSQALSESRMFMLSALIASVIAALFPCLGIVYINASSLLGASLPQGRAISSLTFPIGSKLSFMDKAGFQH